MIPSLSNQSNSSLRLAIRAYGTGLDLQNLGLASFLRVSLVEKFFIVPRVLEKSGWYFSNRVLSSLETSEALLRRIACQLRRIFFDQFLPNSLGPSLSTTNRGNFYTRPPYLTDTSIVPITEIVSAVYDRSTIEEGCNFAWGNKLCCVSWEIKETAAPVSNSIEVVTQFNCSFTIIGEVDFSLFSNNIASSSGSESGSSMIVPHT